jgi:hypothetical protein
MAPVQVQVVELCNIHIQDRRTDPLTIYYMTRNSMHHTALNMFVYNPYHTSLLSPGKFQ